MTGLLLVNLGTPDDPSPGAVGKYLDQFLMDPYVIGAPEWLRSFLVRKLILPRRSVRSSEKYKSIWTERGSPLKFHSQDLLEGVREKLSSWPVALAFRYGNPSIKAGLEELTSQGVKTVLVLPLYPHFADSSVKTVMEELKLLNKEFGLKILQHDIFYSEDWFLRSWAEILVAQIEDFKPDHLLFSYHGIPISHVVRAHPECRAHAHRSKIQSCPKDCGSNPCYIGQCHLTSQMIAKKISEISGLGNLGFSTSFQSRLGPFKWTEPNTVQWLERLYKKGIRRPLVVCPSFVSDCLETLEEIGIEERRHFLALGGEDLRLSPCLNAHPTWIRNLSRNLSLKLESL